MYVYIEVCQPEKGRKTARMVSARFEEVLHITHCMVNIAHEFHHLAKSLLYSALCRIR